MLHTVLAQAQPGSGWMGQLIIFGGIILVFYFFMIRPQQKKQKEQKQFTQDLKKGDPVITAGGLHGKVYTIEDDKIILEVDKGTKLTFEKSSISLDMSKKLQGK